MSGNGGVSNTGRLWMLFRQLARRMTRPATSAAGALGSDMGCCRDVPLGLTTRGGRSDHRPDARIPANGVTALAKMRMAGLAVAGNSLGRWLTAIRIRPTRRLCHDIRTGW